MLRVPLDLSPVSVHKSLGVTQALAEERLELVLYDQDKSVCIMSPLVLLPAETDPVPEERCGKENLDRPRSSSGSKIVLTLLTEVVAVYVGLSAVYIRQTSLQLLPGCLDDLAVRAGAGAGARTGARTGTLASRTVLRIRYKSSSEYLGILVAAVGALAMGGFVPKGPAGWSDNLSPDSEGEEKSGGAMEGAAEERSWQRHLQPRTEVILELISSKTLFQTG